MVQPRLPWLPPASGWPPRRQWPLLLALAMRAAGELLRARWRFGRIGVAQITALNRPGAGAITAGAKARVAWIGFVLPRVARRMPFRADCLVQALAGQAWLAAHGIASQIVIGVERPTDAPFGAHAWLCCGGATVTGGEVSRYTPLL